MAGKFSIIAYLGLKSKEFLRGLAGAKGASKNVAGKIGAAMGAMAKAVTAAIVAAMVLATAAIIKFGVDSLKSFAAFEKGMNTLFVLMHGITKKQMNAMQDEVIKLSRELGITTTQIIPAMRVALAGGIPKANIIEFMRVAAKLAIGGVVDLELAVRGLSKIMHAYGTKSLSVQQIADVFTVTVNTGITSVKELASSFFQVIPVAAKAGIQFQDVGAAIAVLTTQGVPANIAMTQMRSAILSITAPSDKARQVAGMLGLSFEHLTKIIKQPGGLKTAMQLIMKVTGGNMALLKALIGRVQGVNFILGAATGNFHQLDAAMAAQAAGANAYVRAYDVMNKGLSRNWTLFKTNIAATMLQVGKALAPIVSKFIPLLHGLANVLAKIPWDKFGKAILKLMGQIKLDLQPTVDRITIAWRMLMKELAPLVPFIQSKLTGAVGTNRKGLVVWAKLLLYVIKLITFFVVYAKEMIAAYKRLLTGVDDTTKKMGTFGAIIRFLMAVLKALAFPMGLLIKNAGWLVTALGKVITFVTGFVTGLTQLVKGSRKARNELLTFEFVGKVLKMVFWKIIAGLTKFVMGFIAGWSWVIKKVIGFIKQGVIWGVSLLIKGMQNAVANYKLYLRMMWGALKWLARAVWQHIKDQIAMWRQVPIVIWEAFAKAFPRIAKSLSISFQILHRLIQVFIVVVKKLWKAWKTVLTKMVDSLRVLKFFVLDVMNSLWKGFKATFPRLAKFITDFIDKAKLGFIFLIDEIVIRFKLLLAESVAVFRSMVSSAKLLFLQIKISFIEMYNFVVKKLGLLGKAYEALTGKVLKMEVDTTKGVRDELIKQMRDIQANVARQRQIHDHAMGQLQIAREKAARERARKEKADEHTRIMMLRRALLYMKKNTAQVMSASLKDLEAMLKKEGEAGEKAMKVTELMNKQQVLRMMRVLVKLGGDRKKLSQLTGEEIRKQWMKTGDKGKKVYELFLREEKRLAAEQLANAQQGLVNNQHTLASRTMTYAQMIKYNKDLADKKKAAETAEASRRKTAAAAEKKRMADELKMFYAVLGKKYNSVTDYLYKKGRAQFHVDGMWVKANNSQEAIEKARAIKNLKRLGIWKDRSGKVWNFRALAERKSNKRLAEANMMERIRTRRMGGQVVEQKRGVTQQSYQLTKLRRQVQMDDSRTIHARRYADQLARAATIMHKGEKVHSNAVVMTFHMSKYADKYRHHLTRARFELDRISQIIKKLPSGGYVLNIGKQTMKPIIDELQKSNTLLFSIDKSLKGKFTNQ